MRFVYYEKYLNARMALLVIDLQRAFVDPESPHAVAMARETIPACKRVIETTRSRRIPIFFVKRIYRDDGSDVELTRWAQWKEGGRALRPQSTGFNSAEYVEEIHPQPGDYLITKKRWSAFFKTEMDLLLHRLGIETVVLIGAATPNCIRATAYDASSYDFEVVIIQDCCSSNTPEIQEANIQDLNRMGAIILDSEDYMNTIPGRPFQKHWREIIRQDIRRGYSPPQTLQPLPEGRKGWIDYW